ncbi:hypothetical protein QYZ88_007625 [Lachnospiraceae bacterium C1.1]|nr:hypothetical protein [Lachnospiraceae bacterium C1.1]
MERILDFCKDNIEYQRIKFRDYVKRGPFFKNKDKWLFDVNNIELFRDAVWQAYLDANRTFKGIKGTENRIAFDNLAKAIQRYFIESEAKFEHDTWCESFRKDVEKNYNYPARYGQAQKVVNMAFKYLYSCTGAELNPSKFEDCHMPFDQYTLLWLFFETGVLYKEWSWFNHDLYIEAQSSVKSILGENVLGKEYVIWSVYENIKIVDLHEEYNKDTNKSI